MKRDNLWVGISTIICALFPIISITLYEIETNTRIGYYGLAFLPSIVLGILVIIAGIKKEKNKDE